MSEPLNLDAIKADLEQRRAWQALPIMVFIGTVRRQDILELADRLSDAVPALIAEIERLRAALANAEECIDAMSKSR